MSNFSKEQTLFLELLAKAVWGTELELEHFSDLTSEEWLRIEEIAQEQSVLALIGDIILDLTKEFLPPRDMCLSLVLKVKMIEQSNRKQNKALALLKEDYDEEDLPFVLIKGQSLASYYPKPLLRSCGDIDVYLYRKGDYERANEWAKNKGYRLEGTSVYEQFYWRGKVAIENHLYLMYFGRKKYDEALQQLLEPIIRDEAFAKFELDGKVYQTLPLELNAIYVFIHILHHFSYLGIGLRQICDWFIFLDHHKQTLDVAHFQMIADRFDLQRPLELFALMGVRYLGVSEDIFPFALPKDEESERLAVLILEDVFRGGNFGLETFSGKKFKNIWLRRIYMFRKSFCRSYQISPISPEHIRHTPLIGAVTRIKLTLKELF